MRHAALTFIAVLALGAATRASADDAFMQWFAARGGKAPHLALQHFAGMGRGVAATDAIAENDLLLSVPLDIVISRDTVSAHLAEAHKSATGDAAVSAAAARRDAFAAITSDENLVAMFLLLQQCLGSASPWAPYVKLLPTRVPVAFLWDDGPLAALQECDPGIAARSRRLRKEIFATYASYGEHGVLKRIFGDTAACAATADGGVPDASAFAHAIALVDSRALTIQGRKYLVPFADMFNCEFDQTERDHESGANFLKYHILGKETFDVRADRATTAGGQVFEDYGDNPSAVYLEHHGFVAQDNQFDCVLVELPPVRSRRKGDIRRLLRLQPPRSCVAPNRALPAGLLYSARLLAMTADEAERCASVLERDGVHRHTVNGPKCFAPGGGSDLDARARGVVAAAARKRLTDFPTTADDDKSILDASARFANVGVGATTGGLGLSVARLHEHERMAVSYRLGRKAQLLQLIKQLSPES